MVDTKILDEILDKIEPTMNRNQVEKIKREVCKDHNLDSFIRNSQLLKRAVERNMRELIPLLRKRPMRSASGIVNIAIMSYSDCPHGRCTYCPKGEFAPNSYTGFEPSTMRGIQNKFDAYSQVKARITQLEEIGHPTDKCELIIQGGTFLAQDPEYQRKFVLGMYNALNEENSESLEEAIKKNETAPHRCVGLTIETRPDWCFESHINQMLSYGTTRVEIGVQTLKQEILAKTKRGHSIMDVWKANQLARDSLLKVCFHMMPGLYATPEMDVEMFKELFENEHYKPDMLKIYPLLILKDTEIYEEWKQGKIKPYNSETAAQVIAEAYKYFPYYVRVMRVQRDIPAYLIEDGVKRSNLREMVESRIKEAKEIRLREVGLKALKENLNINELNPELIVRKYRAAGSDEIFLSFEDKEKDVLFGFLRLRDPYKPFRKEITERSMGIRELHVYGEVAPIGKRDELSPQHRGLGRRLLEEAERISKEEYDANKILVISGVGVREYYRKFGYKLDGPYMSKEL